jgi:hypothetical protein
MVCDDKDRVLGAFQEIVPVFESSNDGKEFAVIDWISLFSGRECL